MANLSSVITHALETGSSSGINYITNPSATSDLDGWSKSSGSGTLTRETTDANLPRANTTGTGFAFTSSTDEEYVYTQFTLDSVDVGSKLKALLDYLAASANFRLEMWKNSASDYSGSYTEVTLEHDVSGDSYLVAAASSAHYETYFGTDSTRYMELRIVHNGTNSDTIYFSDVLVGPGSTSPVPVVGKWNSSLTFATPTNLGTGSATNTVTTKQTTDTLHVKLQCVKDGSGGSGASSVTWTMPTGYTIDTSKLQSNKVIGNASFNGTNYGPRADVRAATSTTFVLVKSGAAAGFTGADFTANGDVEMELEIPIAEWAGATASVAGAPQMEWAADDGSSDVFGPNGALVPNVAFGTGSTSRAFSFQYSQQSTQDVSLEVNYRGNGWSKAADVFPNSSGNNAASNNVYGMTGLWTSTTTYTVIFGNQGTQVAASNTSNGITSWADEYAAGTRFRVVRAQSASLPYQKASATQSGLYKAGEAPGASGASAISSGNIGQVLASVSTLANFAAGTGNTEDVTTLALPTGIWEITAHVVFLRNGANFSSVALAAGVSTTAGNSLTGTTSGVNYINQNGVAPTGFTRYELNVPSFKVRCDGTTITRLEDGVALATGTTLRLKAFIDAFTSGTPQHLGKLVATRVA